MKYRALCPNCGVKIPRSTVFRMTGLPHPCKSCGCQYRPDALWEWSADFIFAAMILTVLLMAWFHHLAWTMAVILVFSIFALVYAIFPYITPFVLVGEKQPVRAETCPRRNKFRLILYVCLVGVLLYVASYLFLTYRGSWCFSQSGELRHDGGILASDIVEWRPQGLYWQGRFKDIRGRYASRGNLLGYFYCPLIGLDRAVWHRTRLSPVGELFSKSPYRPVAVNVKQPTRAKTNAAPTAVVRPGGALKTNQVVTPPRRVISHKP